MKKTLVALRTTVSLGKVTVLQDDNPRSGCVAIADFGEVKQYGVGSTYSEPSTTSSEATESRFMKSRLDRLAKTITGRF